MTRLIRALVDQDWPVVLDIYAAGITTRNATFETDVPPVDRLQTTWIPDQRWVIEEGDNVIGWAAMTRVSGRHCYRGVAETSIYIHPDARGSGVGRQLLNHQVAAATDAGYWTLQTSIFPENLASLAIHHQAGFRDVGRRERIAQLDDVWRDTILLERRT